MFTKEKTLKIFAIMIAAVSAFVINARAEDSASAIADEIINQDEIYSAAPQEAKRAVEGYGFSSIDFNKSIKNVVAQGADGAKSGLKTALSQVIYFIAVSLICGIAASFADKTAAGAINPVALCGTAAVMAGVIGSFGGTVNLCRGGITKLAEFSEVLLPSVAAACAAVGKPTAGSVAAASALLVTGIAIRVITNALFPAVYIYIAALCVNAAVENELILRAAGFIKSAVTNLLKWCLILYTAYSGITTAVSASADAAAAKTAKFAISGVIPVVGSIVSDAAGVVLSGASVIKNSIGIFGLVAITAICVTPFLNAGINYLAYKCASAVCSVTGDKAVSKLIDGIGDGFGMALGMLGTVAVLFFISVVLSVTMVTPA